MEFFIPRRGAHWCGGGEFLIPSKRSLVWRWNDPSLGISYFQERRSLGGGKIRLANSYSQESAHWSGDGKIPRKDPSREISYSQQRRSLVWQKDPSRMIRLGPWNFLFLGEAVTGLEAERSVLGISYLQERCSLVWRRKDPSGEFLILRRGAHWSVRRKDPSWEFLIPRRGAHWSGGGKIRLGNFLFPEEALAGVEAERSVSGIPIPKERRSLVWRRKDPSRMIRFGPWNFLFPGEALTGLEAERSVLEGKIRLGSREKKNSQRHSPEKMIRARVESSPRSPSFRAAAPLPIELWILASPAQRLQCQRASPADRLSGG